MLHKHSICDATSRWVWYVIYIHVHDCIDVELVFETLVAHTMSHDFSYDIPSV